MNNQKQETAASARELLRHTLATLAYRARKVVTDVPGEIANLKASETTRTPKEILAHICDLLDWGLSVAQGEQKWSPQSSATWDEEVERLFAALERLDSYLASDQPLGFSAEKIFQGPIADALTHVGQIALLRRIGGARVRGENYFGAQINSGQVGRDQPKPAFEFD